VEIDLSINGLKSPADLVSSRMVSDLFGGRKPNLSDSGKAADPAEFALNPLPFGKNLFESALGGSLAYAESLFRPLTRRRFRTFWPSVVRMRMRNPWVLLRLRLFGWKVRFILSGPFF
jgi:hypothetical protein